MRLRQGCACCSAGLGLYSGVTGHHFARPGNRFWPALHLAGFTPRQLAPAEQGELLALGYGITNLVARITAGRRAGARRKWACGLRLDEKLATYRPRALAVLGVTAFRSAFGQPRATLGRQPGRQGVAVWVLPNPSGLNAHYQLADLARVYAELRLAVEQGQ